MPSCGPRVLVLEAAAKAALPVIWSAAAAGRVVVAGASSRICCGMFSRFVRERLLYPDPTRDPDGFLRVVLGYLAARPVDMLYPVGDVATDLVARHQDEIGHLTRVVVPSYETFVRGRDKILTLKAAVAAGVPIPRTWCPHESSLDEVARAAAYPCLVKPAISAGARGIVRAESQAELTRLFPLVEAQYGRCFVQDFVPSGGMQLKTDAVIGRNQAVLAAVVYEKLRFYPPHGGSSVLNRTVIRPDVVEQVRKMAVELHWFGFCDFDWVLDPRDGEVKLMEINPRFPESFRATYAAGVDMVDMLWEMAHDREPQPVDGYAAGRYLRFFLGDLLWMMTSKDRFTQLRSWFTFLSPDLLYQVLSARDPMPALGYLLENARLLGDPARLRSRLRRGAPGGTPRAAQ